LAIRGDARDALERDAGERVRLVLFPARLDHRAIDELWRLVEVKLVPLGRDGEQQLEEGAHLGHVPVIECSKLEADAWSRHPSRAPDSRRCEAGAVPATLTGKQAPENHSPLQPWQAPAEGSRRAFRPH